VVIRVFYPYILNYLGVTLDYLLVGKDRDIAGKRLMEIETRKAAARVMKLADQIHEEISQIRPLG